MSFKHVRKIYFGDINFGFSSHSEQVFHFPVTKLFAGVQLMKLRRYIFVFNPFNCLLQNSFEQTLRSILNNLAPFSGLVEYITYNKNIYNFGVTIVSNLF